MSKELLTDRLVTTRSFSPGEDKGSGRDRPDPIPSNDLDGLIRREEAQLKEQSIAAAWTEACRRRGEVLVDIDRAVHVLLKRRDETEQMLQTLSHRREALARIEIDRPGPPPLGDVRRMRQDLHDAHVELTMFQRIDEQAGSRWSGLGEMTVREISRIGWALTWPLIVGVLAAAVIVVVGVRLALVF